MQRSETESRWVSAPLEVRAGNRIGADGAPGHSISGSEKRVVGQRQVMQDARVAISVTAARDLRCQKAAEQHIQNTSGTMDNYGI